jgi:hypothetical protein
LSEAQAVEVADGFQMAAVIARERRRKAQKSWDSRNEGTTILMFGEIAS